MALSKAKGRSKEEGVAAEVGRGGALAALGGGQIGEAGGARGFKGGEEDPPALEGGREGGGAWYLLLLLLGSFLSGQEGPAIVAALGSEVDAGEGLLHQGHGEVEAVHVQPANEVPRLVHALHLHLYLPEKERKEGRAGGGRVRGMPAGD